MGLQALVNRSCRCGRPNGMEFVKAVDSVAAKGSLPGVRRQMFGHGNFIDLWAVYAQNVGDDEVEFAGLDDFWPCGLKYFSVGFWIAQHAQHKIRQVLCEYGLLQEVTAADEVEGFARRDVFDELVVAPVVGQTAQLGTRPIDVAGPHDAPVHAIGVALDEFELTESFFTAVGVSQIVL